ncbi:hypothetical protein O0L34_g10246 [Tuta absoluta]|nr:hypothetical protein O0L34_g10246 [Tuta absoluta]
MINILTMASSVHLRLLGYGVTLAIHGYTSYDVMARLAVTTKDPIVADFATLQDKFLTIWTFVFQIIYVTLGLSCDILQTIGKRNQFLKSIQGLRETLFSAIVWPTSLFVSALFWPFFLYDSGLVFPPYIDKILSWWNNQVMHTYVAFFVFWELMFLERRRRKDKLYLTLLISYMAVYLVVMFSSFIQRGLTLDLSI